MTIEEKRTKLQEFCRDHHCANCPVSKNDPHHKCGRGMSFISKTHGDYDMSDSDVKLTYNTTLGEANAVNHPSHYNQGGIECIDAMVAAFGKEAVENFCLCNAFKYVWRNRDKNGFEDIDKAIWYLEKIKELCSDE